MGPPARAPHEKGITKVPEVHEHPKCRGVSGGTEAAHTTTAEEEEEEGLQVLIIVLLLIIIIIL